MRSRAAPLGVAAIAASVISAVSACAPRQPALTPAHSAAIQDSVRTMLDDLRRYWAAKQWDSVTALYVGDSTLRWVEDGRVAMRSRATLQQGFAAIPPTTTVRTTYDSLEVTPVVAGVASVLASYHSTFTDTVHGNATFGGLLTMTVIHRPGGWRILTGHSSSPRQAGTR